MKSCRTLRSIGVATFGLVALLSCSLVSAAENAEGLVIVTSDADSGPGSLRNALEVQKASQIVISPLVSSIRIDSPLVFEQTRKLVIQGNGQTISSPKNINLLTVSRGADLEISNLGFSGPGGFSINNRGDQGQAAGKGIFVDVRNNQTGTVRLVLNHVSVSGVANHGIHVSDCDLADDCGTAGGSAASIEIKLDHVSVDNVGTGRFDADGVRIDDRGDGDIVFIASNSTFTGVGADGVELDEGGNGDVVAIVRNSRFNGNGAYCDPQVLDAFLPRPDVGKYKNRTRMPSQLPQRISGNPDRNCIEFDLQLYGSGYVREFEYSIDVDDGFDIDEAGPGSIVANFWHSEINDNLDEGIDFDEQGAGMIFSRFVETSARNNRDDGFKLSEEDGGSVIGRVSASESINNGGKGFVFEEDDDGDLYVTVSDSKTEGNDGSGIEVEQKNTGMGVLRVIDSSIGDSIDADGVDEL